MILDSITARFAVEARSTDSLGGSDARTVVLADAAALATIDPSFPGSVIGVCDDPHTALTWLDEHPWLAHVVSAATLKDDHASALLETVASSLATHQRARIFDSLALDLTGRRVRLTRATQRLERTQRMASYFEDQGIAGATVASLFEIANDLLTGAFYDAPVSAGAIAATMDRDTDVELPDDSACDLVYGYTGTHALLRVRDPFGALPRTQVTQLSRSLPKATLVCVSVTNQHHTDVLIACAKEREHAAPFAFHVFYKASVARRFWRYRTDASSEHIFAATTITSTETIA